MDIRIIGINHKTASIEIREKFYCNPIQQELLLSELKNHPSVVEALVLSTCNRTEIYLCCLDSFVSEDVLKILFGIKDMPLSENYRNHFYFYFEETAVKHLLRVTAGLDSLVLGERQVLGQVKESVALARKKAMIGKYLNILTNIAITSAKKAHTETDISVGGVSISWAAVAMAERVLGTLKGKTVLIIGAGKMSEIATNQMKQKGVKSILVMNRTESCAMALAEKYNGTAASFCDIKEVLAKADVCICSVGAPHYVLEKSTVEKVLQGNSHKKLVFIDISMPRNIDPKVSEVENVLLFHLDDLDKAVGENLKKRQAAMGDVEKIVTAKISQFYRKINLSSSAENSYFKFSSLM